MIKDNQKYFNRLHVLIDALIIAGSYILAWFIRFESGIVERDPNAGVLLMQTYFRLLYIIVPVFLILYFLVNLYTPKRATGANLEFINVVKSNTFGIIIVIGGLYIIREMNFSRAVFVIFYILNIGIETLVRNVLRYFLRRIRTKGYNVKYVLLVGYSRAAEEYINRINANPQWGYVIRGVLDDNVPRGTLYKGVIR